MPRTQGTIFEKLTDTAKYTGTHRHRFDDEGNGKGLDGRERVAKGAGSVLVVPPQMDASVSMSSTQEQERAHRVTAHS